MDKLKLRFFQFLLLCVTIFAFVNCFSKHSGWFRYQNFPDGALDTLFETQVAGRWCYACMVVASILLIISFISLSIRLAISESPDWLTPLTLLTSSIGSLFLLIGPISFLLSYLYALRDRGVNDIEPEWAYILGVVGGFVGLIVSMLLFRNQDEIGGTPLRPGTVNIILIIGTLAATTCACFCAGSTEEGWFWVPDYDNYKVSWGNVKYTYDVQDDEFSVEDLSSDLDGVGKTSQIICSIASALSGLGFLFICLSFFAERLENLLKVGIILSLLGSLFLIYAAIQYTVGFESAGNLGFYNSGGEKPYYDFYLAFLGGLQGTLLCIFAYYRNFWKQPSSRSSSGNHKQLNDQIEVADMKSETGGLLAESLMNV